MIVDSLKKISVVTIVRNDVQNIKSTIESVVRIKEYYIEYIVIDGNSSDGTTEVIHEYLDKIDLLISEYDTGIYNAMNKGLQLATGESIIFMNSGDIFHSDFNFDKLITSNTLNSKVVIGRSVQFFEDDCYLRTSDKKIKLLISNPPHQSVFVPKSYFKSNPYDETLEVAADYYWIKNAMNVCGFEINNQVISKFSLGGRSSSNKWKDIITVQKEMNTKHKLIKSALKFILMNIFGARFGYRIIFSSKYKRISCDK